MVETIPNPDASLTAFLAARARHASFQRLMADAAGGFLVATAVSLWRGPAWSLVSPFAICFFAYGIWGITDRHLGDHSIKGSLLIYLHVARTLATILGFAAAFFLVMGAVGMAIGSIES